MFRKSPSRCTGNRCSRASEILRRDVGLSSQQGFEQWSPIMGGITTFRWRCFCSANFVKDVPSTSGEQILSRSKDLERLRAI